MDSANADHRLKVLLLERDRIVRESLISVLEARGLEVVGAHGGVPAFLAEARESTADVALVGLHPEDPGGDSLWVLRALPGAAPSMRVVVLSAFHDPDMVDRAYQLGACAFLHRLDADCASLVSAIQAASRGERLASCLVFEDVLRRFATRRPAADPLVQLTGREREVLACVASGADNLKIAAILDIAEGTVRGHVSSLYRKLGPENRTELAIFARDAGVRPRLG